MFTFLTGERFFRYISMLPCDSAQVLGSGLAVGLSVTPLPYLMMTMTTTMWKSTKKMRADL